MGMQGGYTGAYDVRCLADRRMGTGTLLEAGPVQFQRVRGVFAPPSGDRRLAGSAGSPVPVGFLNTACNSGAGSPERICAFARFGPAGGELWVADLKRTGGQPCEVPPAGSEPPAGCQLLSKDLWVDGAAGTSQGFPRTHQFFGDTLIFRAESELGPGQPFYGPMFAWRPGWPRPLRLVDRAVGCAASETSDAIACSAGYSMIAAGPVHADLWAGRLGDGSRPLVKSPGCWS